MKDLYTKTSGVAKWVLVEVHHCVLALVQYLTHTFR